LEAAERLGCTGTALRYHIRLGNLKAVRVEIPGGFYYGIDPKELKRFASLRFKPGWPTGRKRK
jgi:hypothetical protein